jgi:hypothetical protein
MFDAAFLRTPDLAPAAPEKPFGDPMFGPKISRLTPLRRD